MFVPNKTLLNLIACKFNNAKMPVELRDTSLSSAPVHATMLIPCKQCDTHLLNPPSPSSSGSNLDRAHNPPCHLLALCQRLALFHVQDLPQTQSVTFCT